MRTDDDNEALCENDYQPRGKRNLPMTIFERLGLPETASAEEIADHWWYLSCNADESISLTQLLEAYGQREREAGRAETWEKAVKATCVHNDFGECVRDTARICGYANCPLMKGE